MLAALARYLWWILHAQRFCFFFCVYNFLYFSLSFSASNWSPDFVAFFNWPPFLVLCIRCHFSLLRVKAIILTEDGELIANSVKWTSSIYLC
ncbi:hypothetical protein J3E68DRAFT_271258 [Trichoderma sp. SZMC 28012]